MDPSDVLFAIFLVALAGVLVLDVLDYAPKWRKWIGLGGLVAGTLAFVASKLSRHPKAPTPPRVHVPPPSIEPAARELREQAIEAAREADAAQAGARELTAEDITQRVNRRAREAGKLLVLLALLPGLAHAQPPAAARMEYQGQPGVWYRLDMAQEVEGCIDARAADARRIRLLEAELRLRVDDAANRQAREDALTAALEVSQETTIEAEGDLHRARRRGRILLVVGFVVGLALPTGVVLAFR